MPIFDPLFLALAIPAFLLVGISKGGFGGGLGSMGVPLMALAIPVPQAAAIMLPLLIVMDAFGIWRYRNVWSREHMPILLTGGIIGIVIGYLAFRHLDELWVRLLIGLIAIVFSGKGVLDSLRGRHAATATEPNWPKGLFWSMVSGATSFIANAGGPPIQVYLQPYKMDKTLFVGTLLVLFAIINWLKFFPYVYLGLFTFENIGTSLALLPLAPIGMWAGFWLHHRVDQKRFYFWCNLFLFATGWKLVYDAAKGLFLV
ncbi:MAG: sulfite exporter TauE/SafE family protein [Alphaproteobacteria bacterium]|nr:sulfite exporter TauE/SafE family protein [Alphaproteobacteria bacterium]